jgi:hypothetical protein
LITDRLRQVFAPSVALSMTQTMRELRAAGFSGTESRVKSGLSRLVETGELVSNGRLYSRRNIPK